MSNESRAKEEIKKCTDSPYYFYTTYFMVNGEKATTRLSEEEFNRLFKHTEATAGDENIEVKIIYK